MYYKQKTVKKTFVEEGLSKSADQYKLAESMVLNSASCASAAQHLKTLNRIMAAAADRETYPISCVERGFKIGSGAGALALAADKFNARTQSVDGGEDWAIKTTNIEQAVDLLGAGLSGVGGLVNIAEGVSGQYLIDGCDNQWYKGLLTTVYATAGGFGLGDSVRTMFQAVDKSKKD